MSLLLWPLASLVLTLPTGQSWFYPGRGEAVAIVEASGDPASGHAMLGDLPVERTGWLLAHVDDPAAIGALPDVAELRILRGTGHVVRIRPRDGLDEIALSRALHGRPGVAWAHPDFAIATFPTTLPNDPYVGDEWHLANTGQRGGTRGADIHAEEAWARSTGKGGLVAVVDTGVDLKHPDLRTMPGHDYIDNDSDPSPNVKVAGYEHGTAVSGIAAAIGNNSVGVAGVAYDSSVYAIRMIGGNTTLGDFYNAFVEAVDAGAWVISNSWGYGDKCMTIPDTGVYEDAMAYADTGRGGLGTAVVFAAGNGNCDISSDGLLGQPQVIGVAATGGDDLRESYSDFGKYVDVAAPSGDILTTDITGMDGYGSWKGDDNYYGGFNGTSASTPVVSGTLLLMFAANPRLTAAQARQVLCDTAVKVDIAHAAYDPDGWSPYYGCGRIDAGAAVTAVANSAPEAPVIVAPTDKAWVERVLLQWKPAVDQDGDWLTYQVTWHLDGEADNVGLIPSNVTTLDLTGKVVTGQRVLFTVQAADLWGAGPASPLVEFTVVAHPVPDPPAMMSSGCSCEMGGDKERASSIPALLALAFVVYLGRLLGRRRGY